MKILVLILLADLFLVAAHFVVKLTDSPLESLFDIARDGAPPELFQYAKFAAIAAIFLWMSLRRGAPCYLAWAGLFAYLLLDDAFSLHEGFGRRLVLELDIAPAFGLRAQDFGELAVSGAAMAALLPALIWAYMAGPAFFRVVSHNVALLFAVLVAFGVGVDMAHSLLRTYPLAGGAFGLIEDGGEMIAASLILGYLVLVDEADPRRRSLLTARADRSLPWALRMA